MNEHYGKIDLNIRSHYSQLAYERAIQPDIQERWTNGCLNKSGTEILDAYKTFWDAQPEIQQIYKKMYKALEENQDDYYEELEYWRPQHS